MLLHLFPTKWPIYMMLHHFHDYFVSHAITLFSKKLANFHAATPNSIILAKIHADTPTTVIPFHYFTCCFTHFLSHLCHFFIPKHFRFDISAVFENISAIFQITSCSHYPKRLLHHYLSPHLQISSWSSNERTPPKNL
jgi:hypothetical protein